MTVRTPDNEARRLEILGHYSLPETLPRQSFDRIVRIVRQHFDLPIAVIALVDGDHRLVIAKHGFDAPDFGPVNSLCAHAIQQNSVFVVPDTLEDPRFRNDPFVRNDPKVRFYAGTRLKAADGRYMGTVCLMDVKPHGPLTDQEKAFLMDLAAVVVDEIELRAAKNALTSEIETRKVTEYRLEAIRNQLNLFIENTPAPIAVLNRDMKYIAASRRWCEEYGLRHQEIIGRSHYDIFPEVPDRWKKILERCLNGEALKSEKDSLRRLDGSVIWLRWEIQPWFDENCAVGGIIIFNEIITERLRAAEELERNQRFLNTVLESVKEGIVACNEKGELTLFNPAAKRMLHADVTPTTPEQWPEYYQIYEADGKTLLTMERLPLVRALRGDTVENEELVLAPNARSPTRIICNARAMYTRDGTQIGAVVSMQDITDRVEIEAQYRQAQKMEAVGQLTGGMAHDFNNLLAVVLGNLQLLQRGLPADGKAARRASAAIVAAQRGAELTNRLLAFARKQTLKAKPVDANALISGLSELLSRALGEIVSVHTYLDNDLWEIRADDVQLEAAILNLAINARDAMEEGGHLTIRTRNVTLDEEYSSHHIGSTPGDYVEISVSDSGSGMPAEVQMKAFEPFFTTKEFGKGSGLGLSMVYGFIKQSGGHVSICSKEGHGTTVKMYFPRNLEAGERIDQADPHKFEARAAGSEKILVVEDNAPVRDVAVSLLEAMGYRTAEAANGDAALEILQSSGGEFDLLLTDIIMPGKLNGPALAKVVKDKWPDIKVLYTSGFADAAVLNEADSGGAADLIRKPFRQEELARKIRQALHRPAG